MLVLVRLIEVGCQEWTEGTAEYPDLSLFPHIVLFVSTHSAQGRMI